jgi:hypothetical protein
VTPSPERTSTEVARDLIVGCSSIARPREEPHRAAKVTHPEAATAYSTRPSARASGLRRGPVDEPHARAEHQLREKSSTEQFRTRPSMMRRPNSKQPLMAASSVE